MVRPPRLGKHQGVRVTSAGPLPFGPNSRGGVLVTSISLAGSHTPSESPMRGMGEPQKQIGDEGLGVSGAPEVPPIRIGPIEIGNRHSQHTSATGLTKRPVQVCADAFPTGRRARSASATRKERIAFIDRALRPRRRRRAGSRRSADTRPRALPATG